MHYKLSLKLKLNYKLLELSVVNNMFLSIFSNNCKKRGNGCGFLPEVDI